MNSRVMLLKLGQVGVRKAISVADNALGLDGALKATVRNSDSSDGLWSLAKEAKKQKMIEGAEDYIEEHTGEEDVQLNTRFQAFDSLIELATDWSPSETVSNVSKNVLEGLSAFFDE